ncbi:hypothetical protein DFW101_1461 [Solidesulfovibrio carbinoliphilus subsp. oakridgensis]|uniref:Lipoprotein n=1 Tax=Solidesulfovibrio carbinoliphilus subsp. oakridgensis TaxID=694327 RepID=G7Q8Y3_9BACT|nr:hypothetical protein [Solidesulfovibrio carbinoliphilus]EHJ47469.1 hypothetical protein DFW101_1461 [Solidesulfovibrio carbinoliphilus subsp. oakridgensis]
MATTRFGMLAQRIFIGSLLVLAVTGCARRQPAPEAYATPAPDVARASARGYATQPAEAQRFVVTETQQRFYVDSLGRMHHIVREVTQPVGGGTVYYLENDTRPYFMDASQRLYYRDPAGGAYYIEDVMPIQPSGPVVVYPQAYPQAAYPQAYPQGYAPPYPQAYPQAAATGVDPRSGPGLYYTQPGSREAVPAGAYPMSLSPASPSQSCASQYQQCRAACEGISRSQAHTKPQCLNNCEVIRNNCH